MTATSLAAQETESISTPERILIVTPWFPNRPGEWNAAYIYQSAAALARRGLQVHVLVCRPWLPRWARRFGPEWMRGDVDSLAFKDLSSVTCVRYAAVPGARFRRLSQFCLDLKLRRVLPQILRQTKAQLVHAHTEGLAHVLLQTVRPLRVGNIVTLHGINTDPDFLHAGAQRNRIREALNRADRIVLVGEPLRSFFRRFIGRDDHFRVVPNGFNASEMPQRARPLLPPDGPVRFITVSNLHEGKGIDIAIRSLALVRQRGLQDWTYTIVGAGDQLDALFALTSELGLTEQVTFAGPQAPQRVFELLVESDVFLLPSYREAFGIAYLEAMAAGLIAIGVQGQGPSMFIESGRNGFLVAPHDVEDLSRCILHVAGHRPEMRAVGAAAAVHVRQHFSWDAHARSLSAVYRDVVAEYCRATESSSCH